MDQSDLAEHIFTGLMQRAPSIDELSYWSKKFKSPEDAIASIRTLLMSGEYSKISENRPAHVPGHYYSPVNDVSSIDSRKLRQARSDKKPLPGINLSDDLMAYYWNDIAKLNGQTEFPRRPSDESRYYSDNPIYGSGDAVVLTGMIGKLKPSRIIEIGSGHSSACMLDAVDRFSLDTRLTFIEPYAVRLHAALTEIDRARCNIIEEPVQGTAIDVYQSLDENDLLFIDSTHVCKCDSDVNFEIFSILPFLKTGVMVHFHDIFWPFDYPEAWIFGQKYTWNEAYLVRAFLMNNPNFKIVFFNDYFALHCRHLLGNPQEDVASRQFLANPGGGLWLQKI